MAHQHKKRCSGRVADIQFPGARDELAAIPEARCRLHGQEIRSSCYRKHDPAAQRIPKFKILHFSIVIFKLSSFLLFPFICVPASFSFPLFPSLSFSFLLFPSSSLSCSSQYSAASSFVHFAGYHPASLVCRGIPQHQASFILPDTIRRLYSLPSPICPL